MAERPPSFATKPGDPKDVSWGLRTAEACWRRGDRPEALKWLRRAVEAASEAEADERALELAKIAADITSQVGSVAPSRPAVSPSVPPRPVDVGSARGVQPPARPVPAKVAPSPLSAPPAAVPPKKPDRKSVTNEAGRGRSAEAHATRAPEKAPPQVAELPAPRKRAASRSDRTEVQRRPDRVDEIDAWPTEVLTGADLPAALASVEATKTDVTLAAKVVSAVFPCQAVRVVVWKGDDGAVRIAARGHGAGIPTGAIEASLVALDPAADLVGLFGPVR